MGESVDGLFYVWGVVEAMLWLSMVSWVLLFELLEA